MGDKIPVGVVVHRRTSVVSLTPGVPISFDAALKAKYEFEAIGEIRPRHLKIGPADYMGLSISFRDMNTYGDPGMALGLHIEVVRSMKPGEWRVESSELTTMTPVSQFNGRNAGLCDND